MWGYWCYCEVGMAIAVSIGTNTPKLDLGLGGREGGGPFVPRGHAAAHATDYSSCSSMGDDRLPPTPRHGLSVTRERG